MTTEVSTLSSGNFAEMAKAMGMTTDMSSGSSKQSTLPRLRIWNSPVMGQVEVKGKMKNMEVIEGGMYRLQLPDDTYIYSPAIRIRPFVQRFMYKKYESGTKTFVKTLMSDNINLDLKDTAGSLNCGRPSGYIADYKALPKETQDLMKSIKRVRVIFGEVEMLETVNAQGESIEPVIHPFIWEIDNKDAYKDMGTPFATLGRQKRLPIQHWINWISPLLLICRKRIKLSSHPSWSGSITTMIMCSTNGMKSVLRKSQTMTWLLSKTLLM
jgi:hypothetical protein